MDDLLAFLKCVMIYCVHAQSCWTLCDSTDCSPLGSLYMEFSRQEYFPGLPFPPGALPNPGVEHPSPAPLALTGRFFTTVPPEKS